MKHTRCATAPGTERLRRCSLATAVIVLLLSWDFTSKVHATAGELDPGFGDGGKVVTAFVGANAEANSLILQPDGKPVAAGIAYKTDTDWDFALTRYERDGAPDNTFGISGQITTDFFGAIDKGLTAAVLPDGRIVVAGYTQPFPGARESHFAMACYNSDGGLDPSFGMGGKVVTDFAGDFEWITGVAVQTDGRIVAAGYASIFSWGFALARYNSDGSLDSTFGTGGTLTTNTTSDDRANTIAIQSDGRIVVAGSAHVFGGLALVRYNIDGSLDSTFGSEGTVITTLAYGQAIHALAFTPDGRIMAAAHVQSSDDDRATYAVLRYNSDGSLDTSFGSAGAVILDIKGWPYAVIFQPDWRIVVAGPVGKGKIGTANFVLARLNFDGNLDETFGIDGKIKTDFFGNDDGASSLVLLPDGRLMAAGASVYSPANGYQIRGFALACYQNDLETAPLISGAEVLDKKLYVYGKNFNRRATILVDGQKQKTSTDEANQTTVLIGNKAGKKITPGETAMLQVKTIDGRLSNQLMFTRPIE